MCVVVWRGDVTPSSFEQQRLGLAQVVQRNPGGAAFLCVVEETSKPPNEELRKASAQMVAQHGDRLKCIACVIEGDGFKAALTRSVLSGIALLVANRHAPLAFFSNVHQAGTWMRRHWPVDARGLEEASGQLKAMLS